MPKPAHLTIFLEIFREKGHRQATWQFIERIAGEPVTLEDFYDQYKTAVQGVRCCPSKARHLFSYLVKKGIIQNA